MISTPEKSQIKRVLQDPAWAAVQHCAEELIKDTEASYVVKDNEWETIKCAISRESRIQGIKDFIAKLYHEAQ